MHASTPPTEYVPDVHSISAVFKVFGYFPAPAVEQYADPGVEEYEPTAEHAVQSAIVAPPFDAYLPAAQGKHLSGVVVSVGW